MNNNEMEEWHTLQTHCTHARCPCANHHMGMSEHPLAKHAQPLPPWLEELVAEQAAYPIPHRRSLVCKQHTCVPHVLDMAAILPMRWILGLHNHGLLGRARWGFLALALLDGHLHNVANVTKLSSMAILSNHL